MHMSAKHLTRFVSATSHTFSFNHVSVTPQINMLAFGTNRSVNVWPWAVANQTQSRTTAMCTENLPFGVFMALISITILFLFSSCFCTHARMMTTGKSDPIQPFFLNRFSFRFEFVDSVFAENKNFTWTPIWSQSYRFPYDVKVELCCIDISCPFSLYQVNGNNARTW